MFDRAIGHRVLASVVLALLVVAMAACSQATPSAQPTAAPKPAAPAASPAAAPAAQPTAAPKPASTIELRAGASNPKGAIESDALDKYAEVVKQKSNGQIVVNVYYQSLGTEQQLAQAVMSGSVDMGQLSNGNSARFTTAYTVYDLPFLFKNYDNILKSLDGPLGAKAIAQFEKDLGVKVLYPISMGGGRDIQTRDRQLKVPADIKGIKIRTVSTPVDLGTFKAWGANPTPIDWAQTYAALQQGVVDGTGIAMSSIPSAKLYEVVKYNLRIDYQMIFQQLYINSKKLESLSADQQKILLDAGKETKAWQWDAARAYIQESERDLTGKFGMQIYQPTPAEYEQWASVREQIWKDVAAEMKIDLDLANQMYKSQ